MNCPQFVTSGHLAGKLSPVFLETSTCTSTEIERKRLEAMAKRQARNAQPSGRCSQQEIERKRREALAKLVAKRKSEDCAEPRRRQRPEARQMGEIGPKEDSPIKCSPEEIEQKRREALAKLEARKKQEIIERNRLAAIERLKMKRTRQPVARKLIP